MHKSALGLFTSFLLLIGSAAAQMPMRNIPIVGGPVAVAFPSGLACAPSARWEADCIGSSCSNPSDGTNISTWGDEAGTGRTATVAAGTVTFHTNKTPKGKPSLTFSSAHLSIANSSGGAPIACGGGGCTFFAVIKLASTAASSGIISGINVGAGDQRTFTYDANVSSKEQAFLQTGVVVMGTGTLASDTTTWHQMNVSVPATGSSSNKQLPTFRIDQAADSILSSSTGYATFNQTTIGWNEGCSCDTFNGQMAALIAYQCVLTTSDKQAVEAYLADHY